MKGIYILLILGAVTIFTSNMLVSNTDLSIDYVPDEETAIEIAETILTKRYGEIILGQRPFKAELKKSDSQDSVWVVKGSLKEKKGGVAIIVIRKKDCKVVRCVHEK